MATRNRTPSVDPRQTIEEVQAMLSFVANAILESDGKELDYGRFLILNHCHDELEGVKAQLKAKQRLEVVNG